MAQPKQKEEWLLDEVADVFRLLSEVVRLRMMQLLAEGSATVGEVAAALEIAQPTASKHLKQLYDGGLVTRTMRGTKAIYRLSDNHSLKMVGTVEKRLTEATRARFSALKKIR